MDPAADTVNRTPPQPGDQEMLDLHLAGSSYQTIADAHGLTRERVRQKIRRADPDGYLARQEQRRAEVEPSAAALLAIEAAKTCAIRMDEARQLLSTLAEERANAIRSALEAGVSQADVARALGVSPNAVNNLLRQH